MLQTTSGRPVGPNVTRTTFENLMDMIRADYAANGRKWNLDARIKSFRKVFGGDYANQITTDRITKYVAMRLQEGDKPATVNRELAILRRAFNLADRADRVGTMPHFD